MDVSIPVTGVSLNKTSLVINKYIRTSIIATVSPEDATNKNVTWKVANGNVSINAGIIEGLEAGEDTITVFTNDGGFSQTCKVTVLEALHYDSLGRLIVGSEAIKISNIVQKANELSNLKPNTIKINIPRRGPSYKEEWISFFSEILHDITLLMKKLNSDAAIHKELSLKEYIHNNLVSYLEGEAKPQLLTINNGIQLYEGTTPLDTMYIRSIRGGPNNIRESLAELDIKIAEVEAGTKKGVI